jgi:hypothetical protein
MSMYILVAVLFGVVAGVISRSKGRSVIGWFLVGLIIGPFSLIVAVLPVKPQDGRFIECPACCEVIQLEARICHHCGSQISRVE